MRKLISFTSVSLDGYFADQNGDMGWAHRGNEDAEWNGFVAENAKGGGELLFGRITYDLMKSYWPTPMAAEQNPTVAEGMNKMPKVVFSRTLDEATWSNTKLIKGDLAAEVGKLKAEEGPGIAILGSGSIVAQLAEAGLIDEFQIVVCPIVLGQGRTLFQGVEKPIPLKRITCRAFDNGNVFLTYEPG